MIQQPHFWDISKSIESLILKEYWSTYMSIAVLVIIVKRWRQCKCLLVNELLVNKVSYVYTMKYYSALKKETMSYGRVNILKTVG
jgi:hypothetical protein